MKLRSQDKIRKLLKEERIDEEMNDKITFVNCRVRNTKKCNKCYVKVIQSWLAHTPSFSRDIMTVNGEYKKKAKKKKKKGAIVRYKRSKLGEKKPKMPQT